MGWEIIIILVVFFFFEEIFISIEEITHVLD